MPSKDPEVQRATRARYYAKHKEELLAKQREYRATCYETVRAVERASKAKNKEQHMESGREYSVKYYWSNRPAVIAAKAKYRAENKDAINARQRAKNLIEEERRKRAAYNTQYALANADLLKLKAKVYRVMNAERLKEQLAQYRIENREKLRNSVSRYQTENPEMVIKSQEIGKLKRTFEAAGHPIHKDEIPPELIQAKVLKRLVDRYANQTRKDYHGT